MATSYNSIDLSPTPSPSRNGMIYLKHAAETISDFLKANGITHAFYGTFALFLLGNIKLPDIIDVVVDTKLLDLHKQLKETGTGMQVSSKIQNDGVFRIIVEHKLENSEIKKIRINVAAKDSRLQGNVSLHHLLSLFCATKEVPILSFTQLVHTKLKVWSKHDEEGQVSQHARDVHFVISKAKEQGHVIDKDRLKTDKKCRERIADFCKECPVGLTEDQHKEVNAALE